MYYMGVPKLREEDILGKEDQIVDQMEVKRNQMKENRLESVGLS